MRFQRTGLISILAGICLMWGCSFESGDQVFGDSDAAGWDTNLNSDNLNNANDLNNANNTNNLNNANNNTNNLNNANNANNLNNTNNSNNLAPDMDVQPSDDMNLSDPDDMDSMPDASTPDEPDAGADAGSSICTRNSECPGTQLCCPDLSGEGTCQDTCNVSGLCETQTDCAPNDECCDLSAIGVQSKLCAPTCGSNSGNSSCQTNADCMGAEKCCPGLGQSTCEAQCLTGGACSDETDCVGNQECCDLFVGKQCLDQCGL